MRVTPADLATAFSPASSSATIMAIVIAISQFGNA